MQHSLKTFGDEVQILDFKTNKLSRAMKNQILQDRYQIGNPV